MNTKNLISLFAALCIGAFLNAQTLTYNWAKVDNAHRVYIYDKSYTFTDGAGNIYWVYCQSVDGPVYATTISKYTPAGTQLFTIQMGNFTTASGCYLTSATVDNAGNIYIAGNHRGSVYFDPTDSTNVATGAFINYLAKYDSSGNFVFRVKPHNATTDAIAVDNNENIYLGGSFVGTGIFYGTPNIHIDAYAQSDAFVAKYDTAGSVIWAKHMGGSNYDYANAIELDANGSVYVTGSYWGTANFNQSGSASLTSTGFSDGFVARYSPWGDYLWAKSFGGSTDDKGNYIKVNGSSVLVCGYAAAGQFSIRVYGTGGTLAWSKTVTGTGKSQANGLGIDDLGNILVTGYFTKTTDFDPGTGVANLTSTNNSEDIFIAKYSSAGNYLWAKKMGDSLVDISLGAAYYNNNLYVSGRFTDTLDFDFTANVANQIAQSDTGNAFLVSYDLTVSSQADIITFSVPQQLSPAVINAANQTVNINVPLGTDLTNLLPTYTVSPYATSTPASGVAQNFSAPFVYVVTAQDGFTIKNWTVYVHVLDTAANITGFFIPQQLGLTVIDSIAQTVSVDMPASIDFSALTPIFTVSPGATANPVSGTTQNFSAPFTYVVTAEDGVHQKNWVVTLNPINDQADILTFSFPQQASPAVINNAAQTVAIAVVAGSDLSNLTPTYTISANATSTPLSGIAQNFTQPFTYGVTAQDGVTHKDWVVTVSVASGLTENTKGIIAIYPNPAQEIVTIELPANAGAQLFTITDVTGKILWGQTLVNAKNTIDVSAMPAGIYLWKLGDKAGKLVVQH